MKKSDKEKNFTKLIILLLIISIIWFILVIEMLYNTFTQDNNKLFFLFNINYATQLIFVYAIGTVLVIAYALIVLNKPNTGDHYFN